MDPYDISSLPSLTPALFSQTTSSLFTHFKNAITNLTYNITHSTPINLPGLFHQKLQFLPSQPPCYLLGTPYTHQTQTQFQIHFKNTIWFSYRKNIPEINNDTGWGCMIRSSMMMIAEGMKRGGKMTVDEILEEFQGMQGKYSINAICREGQIENRWTTANEVMAVCSRLSISSSLSPLTIINIPCEYIVFTDFLSQLPPTPHPTLLILHTMLGPTDLHPSYIPHLKSLMRLKQFCGMLGGSPGKAMYIVGYKNDTVVGLDPHYVQDEQGKELFYFKECPRGMGFGRLGSSLSIGFYVEGEEGYRRLVGELLRVEEGKEVGEWRALGIVIEEEERERVRRYMNEQEEMENNLNGDKGNKQKKGRKESEDDFQLLE